MDKQYKREIDLIKHLKKSSLFLFGPRNTGKSFLINASFKKTKYIFLDLFVKGYNDSKKNKKFLDSKLLF
jgi:AAA+ ATPase superfamily predicted ATPase